MAKITDIQIIPGGPKEPEIIPQKPENPKELRIKEQPPKKKRKWLKIFLLFLLLLVLAGAAIYLLWPAKNLLEEVPSGSKTGEKVDVSPLDTESPLNGVWTTKERARRRPISVMIENHPDARPQSGLDKADLVYESVTEGGITRFLVFYVVNDVSEIGPVRSARTHFVKIADEYNAFYAHVGGSGEALNLIKTLSNFYDLNQFSLGKYFWRDKKRYAPHNVYATTDKLREAGESKGWDANAEYDKWSFKDDAKADERGTVSKITIDFSSASYKVTYTYDKEGNQYLRNQAGNPHKDKNTGEQIKAKTVIVQYAQSSQSGQYTNIKNEGTGKAEIFMDGKKIVGTWKKLGGRKERTKFYDESGIEVKFNRGPIWIGLASANVKSTAE